MSFALMTYVVDLDVLHASVGSHDDKLRRMIGGRFKQHLDFDDSQFDHVIDEGGPSIRDAIRAVIQGGPYEEKYGFMYGYAYKWICEFHGRYLDNSHFSPMKAGWLESVDEGLSDLGVSAVSLTGLSYEGPPAPIPSSGMESGCGEWSLEECQKALEQWEAVTDAAKADLDPYVLEAAQSAMEWCRIAATVGRGVAGFFS